MQGRDGVADREVGPHRRLSRKAGDVAQPAHRLADRAEAGPLAVWPGLAVAGDAHQDQLGVVARERVPAEVPFLQRPGPEVLDHDVRAARQAAHDLLAFGPAQIAGHRLLVARLHVPPQRGAVAQLAPLAQRIALARRLDLDHLGAEVAQRLGAERPGDQAAELHHPHARERSAHSFFSSRSGLYSRTTAFFWL